LALAGLTISPSYAASDTEIYIVQGLPGKNLDVEIDGESVAEGVKTAAVAGPFKVEPGSRTVTFSENGTKVLENNFSIKEGSKADIVAHLPAPSSGDPLVTVYKYDAVKVPKGKALLVVSHVAAVPGHPLTENRSLGLPVRASVERDHPITRRDKRVRGQRPGRRRGGVTVDKDNRVTWPSST